MDKFIVVTTINKPSKAINAFAKFSDWQLVVVGDRKTPVNWSCTNAIYLSPDQQINSGLKIVLTLPWNHYARKMVGYLEAIRRGASLIVDTDDDNIPYPEWYIAPFHGIFDLSPPGRGFVNIYQQFTDQHIWPRGFPLDRILDSTGKIPEKEWQQQEVQVGIWQGLANGDPDVDAVYRLTNGKSCIFNKRVPIVLDEGTLCPFNSQNTAFRSELFLLLYLPAYVNFRFTDILRGLVAQPILWATGYRLGFLEATVFQERNPHNYIRDFESEIPCYLHPYEVIDTVTGAVKSGMSVADNLITAYEQLRRIDIVTDDELKLLSAWIRDVQNEMRIVKH